MRYKSKFYFFATLIFFSNILLAATDKKPDVAKDVGDVLDNITRVFPDLANLVFALTTVVGICFGVASIFKFKQFKDNPQQITVGQPVSLLILAAAMLWLPFILKNVGITLTGKTSTADLKKAGSTLTPEGDEGSGFNRFLIK